MQRWATGAAIAIFLVVGASARASLTVTPTVLTDPSAGGTGSCPNDPCSLREAVNYVHGQGGGTVSLAPPAAQGEYDLTQGTFPTLNVPGGVSIVGSGPGAVTIKLAAGQGQVIQHQAPQSGGPDVISGVTITGGKGGIGGGILNYGGLTLDHVDLTGNTSDQGGGIDTEGPLTISDSTIDHNTAIVNGVLHNGGGITTESSAGPVTIANTTIAENTAGTGGGIYLRGLSPVTLENVTVADNHATLGASGAGGNIYLATTTPLQADNTIIAGGTAATAGTENCLVVMGASVTGTHNLENLNQCGLTGPGDIVNANPLLGPLQNNGGTTGTVALGVGSPAINAGANCLDASSLPLTHDERSIARPQGPGCDIGAFEFRLPSLSGSPQITGTTAVGNALTCNPPTVTSPDGAPNQAFTWSRDGTPIAGASSQTYTATAADAQHTLTCGVTETYAASPAQGSLSATSAGVSVPAAPAALKPATITHTGKPSSALVAGAVVVNTGESTSCPAGGTACGVTVTGTVPSRLAAAAAVRKTTTVTVANARFTVASGTTKIVRFKLSRKGARLLARLRAMKVTVHITVSHGKDRPVSTMRTIIVKSPKHRR
jgi:hypothetical protein